MFRLEEKLQEPPKTKNWKYNSNRDQFNINANVLKDLRSAKKLARSRRARRRIKQAIRKLERRNKHIRIADTSKSGWRAVELYETNEPASDPEDDRRIKNCDKRAQQIIKEDRERFQRSGDEPGPSSRFRNAPRRGRSPRRDDRCFRCGKYSHWGDECPTYQYNRRSQHRDDRN